MTDQTDLKPHPEHAHLRWHWIEHTAMESEEKIWPEAWMETHWLGRVLQKTTPELAYLLGWRYHGPCDPAAVTIDAGNDRQLAAVRREIESVCSDGNSDVSRVAKNILTALANL